MKLQLEVNEKSLLERLKKHFEGKWSNKQGLDATLMLALSSITDKESDAISEDMMFYNIVESVESMYPQKTGLNFGDAIQALKDGQRVAREGWNGKGMWLALSVGNPSLPAANFWNPHNKAFAEQNGGQAEVLSVITMKTADDKILMGWLASQTDMLSEDWCILD